MNTMVKGKKYTPEEVHLGKGSWAKNCGICSHYRASNDCTMVEPYNEKDGISPGALCDIFDKSLRSTIRDAARGDK